MMLKFSPTIPTTTEFTGPPVTPIDTTTGYVCLPVPPLPHATTVTQNSKYFPTIQKQFREQLFPWQMALYGTLHKAGPTNTLQHLLKLRTKVMIVSDALVQKSGQSGFAWLIVKGNTLVWQGTGLAPGPEDDTYSGHAEAYGLLAAITFLAFYEKCYDNQYPPQMITCHCNNSGIVTNLTSMQNKIIQ